jgi:hypothetical protein
MVKIITISFILIFTSFSSALTPIRDECINSLLDSEHINPNPFPHRHDFKISPSGKWVADAFTYMHYIGESWVSDSAKLYLFRYCYPSEKIFATSLYFNSIPGSLGIQLSGGSVGSILSNAWSPLEDTLYFEAWNSTINTKGKDTSEIFKIDISSITIGSVKASYREFVPQLLKTSNFPNPFIEITAIEYSLPIEGNVAINIFNSKGDLIKVIWQENQKKGSHLIKWNGKDNRGSQIADGIYYYQISCGEFISAKSIIKLK